MFDPLDPSTYRVSLSPVDRLRSWAGGLVAAFLIAVIGSAALLLLTRISFTSRETALLAHVVVAVVVGGGGGLFAGWSRSIVSWVLLLPECIVFVWGAFVAGIGAWFLAWQRMPNAPDEAFNDTGALGAVLVGWIPAVFLVGIAFTASFLASRLLERPRADVRR
ncbi:MAG: hypothetical protein AAGI53_00700 [Planctomycetota bacterium]